MAFEQVEYLYKLIGASPSGKALVFGTGIRRFESFRPRILKRLSLAGSLFNILVAVDIIGHIKP